MESEKPKRNIFPGKFLWGASTASHQVEGGTYNQWTVWELEHASRLAKNAARRAPNSATYTRFDQLPNWSAIKHDAQDPANYISGEGVKHYSRYKEDLTILKKLNLNSFRFGIEWSRLEPREGEWDLEAVEHYREYIREINRLGIEPFLNIWHWTLPVWFSEKGGFEKKVNLKYWDRFVEKIGDEYGSMVRYVITINEPNVYSTFSYALGLWPPQQKDWIKTSKVIWNLVLAHRRAYKILKKMHPKLQIGIAQQVGNIQAKRQHNLFDQISTKLMRYFWNWWMYKRIKKQQDFVGFNYYFTDYYTGMFKRHDPGVPTNDMGWYMEPEGLYPLLLRISAKYPDKPIFITENGVADGADEYRRWWLEEAIVAMERAISEGVDLQGYFHWSLLDNFEWDCGWWPKFGLVEVDRKNDMKRTIRPSAKWLAAKIKQFSDE